MSILIVPFIANTNLDIYKVSASLPFLKKKSECLLETYVNLGAGLWIIFFYHWTWSAVCWKCWSNFCQTHIFGWLVVFEAFNYIIINEPDCYLQQLYPLKIFQRDVFSSVISQRKIWMADLLLYINYISNYMLYNYISNRNIATIWQKVRNLVMFVLPNTEQSRQNRSM